MLSILCGIIVLALALCLSSSVYATSVWVKDFESEQNAMSTWNDFSNAEIIEDFEGISDSETDLPNYQYTSDEYRDGKNYWDSDGIGATFNATGSQGTGDMSFEDSNDGASTDEPELGIIDVTEGGGDDFYGRAKYWDATNDLTERDGTEFFGTNYLDSGDVTEVTLNDSLVDQEYRTLSFFLFDVADQGGTMTITESNGTVKQFDPWQSNDKIQLVNIAASGDNFIQEISWKMDEDKDGWGIDNIGTGAPVPEPSTMLLLGSGLIGVAALGRRKFMKRS